MSEISTASPLTKLPKDARSESDIQLPTVVVDRRRVALPCDWFSIWSAALARDAGVSQARRAREPEREITGHPAGDQHPPERQRQPGPYADEIGLLQAVLGADRANLLRLQEQTQHV